MAEDTVKIVGDQVAEPTETTDAEAVEGATEEQVVAPVKAKKSRIRSSRYAAVRAQVDKTKAYDAFAAVELLKKLSYSKFAGTVTVDIILKEEGVNATLTFPHSTGRSITVVIVNESVLSDIEAGNLNFDVLITEPRFMGQLAKFAKVLGPKGLMPNPKNGTVTSNPELKKKELEGGKITVKSEKKAPLMHISIGKTDMDTKALLENLQTLLNALKGKMVKVTLSATMSPSIRVAVE